MEDLSESLQEIFAPQSRCFGCGPANRKGLRIRSFPVHEQELVAHFTPEEHHEAFPGMVNGGILGALLDCHSNWTAAYILMQKDNLSKPPCTVTADFHVTLRRPTPFSLLEIRARATKVELDRATIEASIVAEGKITATCLGTFVAVKEGHPAFHRW